MRVVGLLGWVIAACGYTSGATAPGSDATVAGDAAGDGKPVARDAPTPPGMPVVVQQAKASAPNGSPLSVTLPSPPTSGDLLVMVGAANHGGLAGVSGGGVATWTRAAQSLINANIEIWFGVTTGSSSTVAISFPANQLPIWMAVSEWSGVATSNIIDGARATAGTASPAGAGAITTTNPQDLLIFGVADSAPNTWGVPSQGAWTAMTSISTPAIAQLAWYQVVSSSGSYGPQVSETAHAWDAAVAAFRVAP